MAPDGSPHASPPATIDVDFASLAIHDADFAKVYDSVKGRVDFQDPGTLQQLTKSLLKRDFGLVLELPEDRLCPPVPVRYEYIRWIQDLLDTTDPDFTDTYDPERQVVGLDVGVGSSCIYPLLGCASRPAWRFGGTEIDDKNYEFASRNVALNQLQSRIRLRKNRADGKIIALDALGIKQADFVMCNPPFFTSKEDMAATSSKEKPPSAICTGAEVEMITEGGDLGFVLRMINESRILGERVQWYSSMLGKLQSVTAVVAKLKEHGVANWAVTCLRAGNFTRRWAVAWSFGDLRPRNDVARRDMTINHVLPFPTEFRIQPSGLEVKDITTSLNNALNKINVKWTWDAESSSGICLAVSNVWSRSARRKQKQTGHPEAKATVEADEEEDDDDDDEPALSTKVTLDPQTRVVKVRWLQGQDSVLFESFCGMLKRKLS